MKSFTRCPKCKDVLLSSWVLLRSGDYAWQKSCLPRLDHDVICVTRSNDDDELQTLILTINTDSQLKAIWNFVNKTLIVTKGTVKKAVKEGQRIPYFEPDLSDYKKVVEKIKTYITFS